MPMTKEEEESENNLKQNYKKNYYRNNKEKLLAYQRTYYAKRKQFEYNKKEYITKYGWRGTKITGGMHICHGPVIINFD